MYDVVLKTVYRRQWSIYHLCNLWKHSPKHKHKGAF